MDRGSPAAFPLTLFAPRLACSGSGKRRIVPIDAEGPVRPSACVPGGELLQRTDDAPDHVRRSEHEATHQVRIPEQDPDRGYCSLDPSPSLYPTPVTKL